VCVLGGWGGVYCVLLLSVVTADPPPTHTHHEQAARGDAVSWCEPEFGPAPYVPTLPYTQVPVADIWQLNSNMAKLLRRKFAEVVGE
jgi:hypothetical protein